MPKQEQYPGGDSDPLPNNLDWKFTGSMRKSYAPKISGSGGGNATGPELTNKRGQQQRG